MRLRIRAVASTLLMFVAFQAQSQVPASPLDTSTVAWNALSARPRLLDTTSAGGIRYPALLFAANVEGTVRLEAVIDRSGAVERGRIRVLSSTHDLFTSAARSGLSRWRFSAPVFDARGVRTAVPISVAFVLPREQAAPWREISTVAIDASGVHVSIGAETIPRDSSIAASPADVRETAVAALLELMPLKTASIDGAVCVGWIGPSRNVPADVLARLRARYPPLRNADQCPPTYQSQILQLDSHGQPVKPPRGAIDPLWIDVSSPAIWTRDYYVVHGRVGRGTRSDMYTCIAHREPLGNGWKATCVRTGVSIA